MVKGIDRYAEIVSVRLLEKSGGQSGDWRRPAEGTAELPRAKASRAAADRGERAETRCIDQRQLGAVPPAWVSGRWC